MPILGITASSILKVSDLGAMFPLQNIIIGSTTPATISFNNIPNTYNHLQIRAFGRFTVSTRNVYYDFNGDTNASNYTLHALSGDGSTAGSGFAQLAIIGNDAFTSSDLTANIFGTFVCDILDYANTNKYKTSRSLSGYDINGQGNVRLSSSLWMNTNAITSITLKPQSGLGGNFAQYTQVSLYGIKAAS